MNLDSPSSVGDRERRGVDVGAWCLSLVRGRSAGFTKSRRIVWRGGTGTRPPPCHIIRPLSLQDVEAADEARFFCNCRDTGDVIQFVQIARAGGMTRVEWMRIGGEDTCIACLLLQRDETCQRRGRRKSPLPTPPNPRPYGKAGPVQLSRAQAIETGGVYGCCAVLRSSTGYSES